MVQKDVPRLQMWMADKQFESEIQNSRMSRNEFRRTAVSDQEKFRISKPTRIEIQITELKSTIRDALNSDFLVQQLNWFLLNTNSHEHVLIGVYWSSSVHFTMNQFKMLNKTTSKRVFWSECFWANKSIWTASFSILLILTAPTSKTCSEHYTLWILLHTY